MKILIHVVIAVIGFLIGWNLDNIHWTSGYHEGMIAGLRTGRLQCDAKGIQRGGQRR